MATNEILEFAGDGGAFVLTQAAYLADAQRAIGNQPGIARGDLVNKAMRQSSLIAAAVAQLIADGQATNVVDTLTPAAIALMMKRAIQSSSIAKAIAGGTANALTADFVPDLSAIQSGDPFLLEHTLANTLAATLAIDGGGALPIVKGVGAALTAGDILGANSWGLYLYDASLASYVLLNPANPVGGTPAQFDNTTKAATTAFVKAQGLQASGFSIVTATGSLAAAHVGATVAINSASATTQTMPAANSVPAGGRIELMNINTGIGTVARAGADTLKVNSGAVTSLQLGNGDGLTLESNGVDTWYAVGGSGQLKYAAVFGASLAAAGYQKLPSGLIVQWGTIITTGTPGSGTWTFPMAFPNAAYVAFATGLFGGAAHYASTEAPGLPSVVVRTDVPMTTQLFAIGA